MAGEIIVYGDTTGVGGYGVAAYQVIGQSHNTMYGCNILYLHPTP